MKRAYEEYTVEQLEESINELEVIKKEKVKEAFSQLIIPSEIWQLIFEKVETDNANLWLTLLFSKSVPETWRDAIRM